MPYPSEVVVRELSQPASGYIQTDGRAFVRPDGTLDWPHLLREFAAFWREHGETLEPVMPYHEVAPQLVLMAWPSASSTAAPSSASTAWAASASTSWSAGPTATPMAPGTCSATRSN